MTVPSKAAGGAAQGGRAGVARGALRDALLQGVYLAGEPMPSSRELASRFGINRNTANKIYQELAAEGLVHLRPNGPPVVEYRVSPSPAPFEERVRQALWPVLVEGRLRSLPEGEIRGASERVMNEFFAGYSSPKVVVAECTQVEADIYAGYLTESLGLQVSPVLIENLKERDGADLVATPQFHLVEVKCALGEWSDRAEGFLVGAAGEDVSQLVSRVRRGPVGVVAAHDMSLERLSNLLKFYLEVRFIPVTWRDPEGIARVIDEAEVIACTPVCRPFVDRAGGQAKAVTVRYRVESASLELLRSRIRQLADGSPSVQRVIGNGGVR